jgi:hypothetical protein
VVAEIFVCRLYLQHFTKRRTYIPNSEGLNFAMGLGLGHEIEFKYFDKNGYFLVSIGTSGFWI